MKTHAHDPFDFDPVTSYSERDDQNLLALEQEIDRTLHRSPVYLGLVQAASLVTDQVVRNHLTDRILNLRDTVAMSVIQSARTSHHHHHPKGG